MPRRPRKPRLFTLLPTALLAAAVASCAPSRPSTTPQPAASPSQTLTPLSLSFVERRIDAAAGRPLLIPVLLDTDTPPPAAAITATLADDRPLQARLLWLGVDDPAPSPPSRWTASSRWLPPAPRWISVPPDTPAEHRPTPGLWAILLETPPDAAGQTVRINARTAPIRWLAPPPTLIDPQARLPQRPEPEPLRADLLDALRAHAASPESRWRVSLLFERLRLYAMTDIPSLPSLADPAVEALADQTEMRWRVAIHRLARSDPSLAVRVLEALTALIRFPEDRLMPAWGEPEPALATLLDDLLDPSLSPGERVDRAADWLARRPDTRVWVRDDAGRPVSPTDTLITLEAARWKPGGVLASAHADNRPRGPQIALEGFSSERLVCVAPRIDEGAPIRAAVGPRVHEVIAATGAVEARPPGAMLGPLLDTWTMGDWVADTPRIAEPPAAVLLQPDFPARSWRLYVECRIDPDDADNAEDSLRVRLGPSGEPHAVLRIDRRGFYVDESDPFADPAPLEIVAQDDRWAASVPVPDHAIEPDDTILVAVERIRSDARRSVWPRPVMPWREQIGRVRVDLSRWGSLSVEDEP